MNLAQPQRIDWTSWVALGAIVLGWFGLNTLVATFGPLQHTARFYDLPLVMINPRRLLFGLDEAMSAGTVVFGMACLLIAALPLLPRLGVLTARWLLILAPLLLMLLCSIVLYIKASSTHISAPESMGKVGGFLARWANGAMDWTGDVVSRHIALGSGAYLSFFASVWLAAKGVMALRTSALPRDSSQPIAKPQV
jgi:hypothetical protein